MATKQKFHLTFDPEILNVTKFPPPRSKSKYTTADLSQMADVYYALKEQRLAVQKVVEELQRQSAAYFHALEGALDPEELSSVAGKLGEASVTMEPAVRFLDEPKFSKWAEKNRDKYPLFKESLDKAVLLDILSGEKPVKVPGVERYEFKSLKILKAKVAKAAARK